MSIKSSVPLPEDVKDPKLSPDEQQKAHNAAKKIIEDAGYWVYQWYPVIGIVDKNGMAIDPADADKIIRKLTKDFVDKQNQI